MGIIFNVVRDILNYIGVHGRYIILTIVGKGLYFIFKDRNSRTEEVFPISINRPASLKFILMAPKRRLPPLHRPSIKHYL